MNATQAFGLEELGRATIDGRRWVAYDDGAYRHVVAAEHYDHTGRDAPHEPGEADADAYSAWCQSNRTAWADDATAARVAAALGMTHVHSAIDGVCGRVSAQDIDEMDDATLARATSTYWLAYAREDGEWDIVRGFEASSDAEANAYAERECDNDDWYVLDSNRRNINGGIDD